MRLRLLLLPLLLLLAPRPAAAQTQTYNLAGTVTSIHGDLNATPYLQEGAPIWGTLLYNPGAGNPQGSVNPPALTLSFGGYVFNWKQLSIHSGAPDTGTFELNGDSLFGSGPLRIVDPSALLSFTHGAGTVGLSTLVIVNPTGPAGGMNVGGTLAFTQAPEPGSLALALPCLLPGVWWLRRGR